MTNLPQHAKTVVDALSLGAVVSTLATWLPAWAALFSIIWTAIRIYETKTVKSLIQRIRDALDAD